MIRLPHILTAMVLILLAGVLSVKHLEERMGTSSVPGLILVDCPALGATALEGLRARWEGATLEWVASTEGLFRPFEPSLVASWSKTGHATTLFASGQIDRNPGGDAQAWAVVLDGFEGQDGQERGAKAIKSAADFLGNRSGGRPFVVGLALEGQLEAQAVAGSVEAFLQITRAYPPSRRTALVLLGERDRGEVAGQVGRRWCLRIPVGDWEHRYEPSLEDLLEKGHVP